MHISFFIMNKENISHFLPQYFYYFHLKVILTLGRWRIPPMLYPKIWMPNPPGHILASIHNPLSQFVSFMSYCKHMKHSSVAKLPPNDNLWMPNLDHAKPIMVATWTLITYCQSPLRSHAIEINQPAHPLDKLINQYAYLPLPGHAGSANSC